METLFSSCSEGHTFSNVFLYDKQGTYFSKMEVPDASSSFNYIIKHS